MKYFTPELLERGASLDNDVADAAEDEWEQALVRYRRRWKKIRPFFPKEAQRFRDESVCLHDAEVLGMGRQGKTWIVTVQPEPPARSLVTLTFTLDGEPTIDPAALPPEGEGAPITWMYEEFDLDRHKQCWFEVLLSNGWSVRLPFRDFRFLIAQRILPAPADTPVAAPAAVMPRSA